MKITIENETVTFTNNQGIVYTLNITDDNLWINVKNKKQYVRPKGLSLYMQYNLDRCFYSVRKNVDMDLSIKNILCLNYNHDWWYFPFKKDFYLYAYKLGKEGISVSSVVSIHQILEKYPIIDDFIERVKQYNFKKITCSDFALLYV